MNNEIFHGQWCQDSAALTDLFLSCVHKYSLPSSIYGSLLSCAHRSLLSCVHKVLLSCFHRQKELDVNNENFHSRWYQNSVLVTDLYCPVFTDWSTGT